MGKHVDAWLKAVGTADKLCETCPDKEEVEIMRTSIGKRVMRVCSCLERVNLYNETLAEEERKISESI